MIEINPVVMIAALACTYVIGTCFGAVIGYKQGSEAASRIWRKQIERFIRRS